MIVREKPDHFVCLTQHDHAHICGLMAEQWQAQGFPLPERRPDLTLAAYEHDRGWIPLDAAPFWNLARQAPYSFLDFPAPPKLTHYRYGLDEVEDLSPYAGLLCSHHYTAFFDPTKPGDGTAFVHQEHQRQQRLQAQPDLHTPAQQAAFDFHLELLKFLDRLSLYLCLNEPGTAKATEHPWYRAGIPFPHASAPAQGQPLQARWLDGQTVQVQPFPFEQSFSVPVRFKQLARHDIHAQGLLECFQNAPVQELSVQLTGSF